MPRPTIWHESARRQFAIRVCVFVKVHNAFDAGTADVRQTLPTLQFRPEAIGSGVLSGSHDQRPFGHCWREGSAVLQCLPTTGGAVSQADYPVAQAYSYPPTTGPPADCLVEQRCRGSPSGPAQAAFRDAATRVPHRAAIDGVRSERVRTTAERGFTRAHPARLGNSSARHDPHGDADDEHAREAADRSPKNGRDCDVSHRSHDAVRSAE